MIIDMTIIQKTAIFTAISIFLFSLLIYSISYKNLGYDRNGRFTFLTFIKIFGSSMVMPIITIIIYLSINLTVIDSKVDTNQIIEFKETKLKDAPAQEIKLDNDLKIIIHTDNKYKWVNSSRVIYYKVRTLPKIQKGSKISYIYKKGKSIDLNNIEIIGALGYNQEAIESIVIK